MRRRMIVLLLLTSFLARAVSAEEVEDSEQARKALEASEIRPLAELLARVESRYTGRVIETELEREHGGWVYDFKFLPDAGHIFSVKLDATTGKVVSTHGPVQKHP